VLGFSGLLSDFRGVFVYLALAALASRVPVRATSVAIGIVCAAFLLYLALFWTSVKAEYREFATGSTDSQYVKVDIDDRFGYLGNRLAASGDIDWAMASYAFLSRLAYTISSFGDRRPGIRGGAGFPPPVARCGRARGQAALLVSARRRCPIPRSMYGWREVTPLRRCGSAHRSALAMWRKTLSISAFPACWAAFSSWIDVRTRHPLFHGHEAALDPARGLALGFVYSVAQNGMEMSLPKMLEPP